MTNLFTYLSNGKLKYICALVVLLCLGVGQMWGTDETITLTRSALGITVTSYTSSAGSKTVDYVDFKWDKIMKSSDGDLQLQASNGVLWNTSVIPGKIVSVAVTKTSSSTGRSTTCYMGTNPKAETYSASGSGTYTFNSSTHTNTCLGYFYLKRGSNAAYWTQVVITYTPATITPSTSSITGLNYNVGSGPSAAQTFTVSGTYLPDSLTVTAPTNFEVSLDGSSWGSSKTINVTLTGSASAGTLSAATVYVRLASGKAAGNYSGNVSIAIQNCNDVTGVTPKTVAVSGTVSAASCSTNPTIGTASLNGSISLSSLPVQTTGWTVGSNCEWSDFGFVWSSSVSTPTLESNGTASSGCTKIQKATSGTATSTSHSITGTFSVGATYYVRGYGKNRYASGTYQYTDVLSITPRSITFNSNGGSSVSTIYVNSGTAASAPTAPTKTGYTFGGWYQESTLENAVNWSSTISANKAYYAKWTAKTTTVSFNQNSGSGGQTGTLTATYDAAMPSAPVTCPTRTGYDFGGYYDGSGGTGTQYYTNTGASARNWDKENSTWTLYAKWTIKNYTVTWKVNGEDYTTGTPTDNVNHGSHVTTLPTAPSTASYCGDKFVGWTDATDGAYVHGTSNLYTKASEFPNATGNQVFYAVFADYVAP